MGVAAREEGASSVATEEEIGISETLKSLDPALLEQVQE